MSNTQETSQALAVRALASLQSRTRDRLDDDFAAIWLEAVGKLSPEQIRRTMRELMWSDELRRVPAPLAFCAQARALVPDPLPDYVQEAALAARQIAAEATKPCLPPATPHQGAASPQNGALNAAIVAAGVGGRSLPQDSPCWTLAQYQRYFLAANGFGDIQSPKIKTREDCAAMVNAQRRFSAQIDGWRKKAWRAAFLPEKQLVDQELLALKLVEGLEPESSGEKDESFVGQKIAKYDQSPPTVVKSTQDLAAINAAIDAL